MSLRNILLSLAAGFMFASCGDSGDVRTTQTYNAEVAALTDSLRRMSYHDEDYVRTAESLYHLADASSDPKAKFLARKSQHNYYHRKCSEAYLDSMIFYGHLAMYECSLPEMEDEYYSIWCSISMDCSKFNHLSAARSEALAMLEDAMRHNNMEGIAFGYVSLAQMSRSQGDEQSMIMYMEQALDIASTHDITFPLQHFYYGILSETLLHEDRLEEAKRYADIEIDISRRDTVDENWTNPAYCMMVEVGYYAKQENPQRFKGEMTAMLDSLRKHDDPDNPYLPYALYYYHSAMGEYKEAEDALDDALLAGVIDSLNYYNNKSSLARLLGEPKKELEYTRKLWEATDYKSEDASLSNIRDLNQMIEESRLKINNQQLQKKLKRTDSIIAFVIFFFMLVITFGVTLMNAKLRGVNAKLVASEKESEKQRDAAVRANEMKTDFIRNMNHEIRTPLNSIVGFSSILAEEEKGDNSKNTYAEKILDGSKKLLKVIDDVMLLSDFDSSDKWTNETDMDSSLNSTIGSVVGDAVYSDAVEIKWKELDEDVYISADSNTMDMIFGNVIGNALKFTTEGTVTIVAERQGDEVIVEVKDTGPGIRMEKSEWIFGRFNKVDTFVQGAGLGLSIARLAAESIGGKVFLLSSSPKGSTFEIVLPISKRKK